MAVFVGNWSDFRLTVNIKCVFFGLTFYSRSNSTFSSQEKLFSSQPVTCKRQNQNQSWRSVREFSRVQREKHVSTSVSDWFILFLPCCDWTCAKEWFTNLSLSKTKVMRSDHHNKGRCPKEPIRNRRRNTKTLQTWENDIRHLSNLKPS